MKRVITVAAFALALAATAGAYPRPPAKYLAKAFTGAPIPRSWVGRWRESNTTNDGVVWQFFPKGSAACEALVAGRTSCFTLRPPNANWFDGGSITIERATVVFRMTYRGRAATVGCFTNDTYPFRLRSTAILILSANPKSCFWQQHVEHFPVHLDHLR